MKNDYIKGMKNQGSERIAQALNVAHTLITNGMKASCVSLSTQIDHRRINSLFKICPQQKRGPASSAANAGSILRDKHAEAPYSILLTLYARFHRTTPIRHTDLNAMLIAWRLYARWRLFCPAEQAFDADINDFLLLMRGLSFFPYLNSTLTDYSAMGWSRELRCFFVSSVFMPCKSALAGFKKVPSIGSTLRRVRSRHEAQRRLAAS